MAISITMALVPRYHHDLGFYRATVRHIHGDDDFANFTGRGRSREEALGDLLSNMVKGGLSYEMVFLSIDEGDRPVADEGGDR